MGGWIAWMMLQHRPKNTGISQRGPQGLLSFPAEHSAVSFARPVLNAKDHMRVSSRNCPPEKQDSLWPADFTYCHSVRFSVAGKLAGTIYIHLPVLFPLKLAIKGQEKTVQWKSSLHKARRHGKDKCQHARYFADGLIIIPQRKAAKHHKHGVTSL